MVNKEEVIFKFMKRIYYNDNKSAKGKDYIDYSYKGIESFLEDVLKKEN